MTGDEHASILVLPPRFTTDSITMSRTATCLGWRVERLSSWRVPAELGGIGAGVYGEPLFVTVVAGALAIEVLEPLAEWLPAVPFRWVKRQVRLTTLGEARRLVGSHFIKPVADKCFAAKVYASGADLPPDSVLDDAELVLVAEPVSWRIEFRAFVLDRHVVTLSPYLREGCLVEQSDGTWAASAEEFVAAEAFCKEVLTDPDFRTPAAFVLDVGEIADRGWAVIEANAAWGSGLYGCDPEMVLRTVRRACVPKRREHADDWAWIDKSRSVDTG